MKNIPTIHELRKQGYKVRVTHIRNFYRFDPQTGKKSEFFAAFQSSKYYKKHGLPKPTEEEKKNEYFLNCKGGETVVEIVSASGKELGKGVAICSDEDAYVKRIGIRKATALALRDTELKKDPYSQIRQLFYKKCAPKSSA
jgi:hypothetical protein